MVFYALIHRRSHLRKNLRRALRAFTLLEIVLALFILGILAAAMTPAVFGVIEQARIAAESKNLDELADSIATSFENTDLTNLNIAALPGQIGSSDTATEFSTSTATRYTTTNGNSWFAKVARLRGSTPQLGLAPEAQPALAAIANNAHGNSRWFFAAPDESGKQRFLVLSLMARNDQLALPTYENNAAWFDAIWNNDWESKSATPPAYWQSRLTSAQWTAWSEGNAGTTQVYHLRVRRIVLPKFRLTVNNNHATSAAFVSFNNVSNAFTAPANSGANTTPEILGGRLVTVNQGTAWPGVEALRLRIHNNETVIIQ